ncbi:hypothetical protein C3492_05615 [Streptomyces sp. Ru62]|uniref:hypothetical protein n=1 Tax=Streptomyces sp. Ru62 TaxID=2080745 RepID=UPI000CDCEA5E|nr:hypothetical protein [Streptomyces sp. Ru62]POX64508.1 hypothetical protein C3492_05615 [Streptomyces sp. Ru62]
MDESNVMRIGDRRLRLAAAGIGLLALVAGVAGVTGASAPAPADGTAVHAVAGGDGTTGGSDPEDWNSTGSRVGDPTS